MNADPWYRRMLNGRAGPWTLPLRGVLRAASVGYGLAVARRNRRYDRPESVRRVAAPVISVGNITVGGTGKTPAVIDLLTRLHALGATPAVVARGYGGRASSAGRHGGAALGHATRGVNASSERDNDEQRLVQSRCPFAICVTDADRVRGAEAACSRGADVIVLDDGFQHRRLARDLDIVLIDATCPFGYGFLLPRGLLREPLAELRRADVVVLTRCDQIGTDEAEQVRSRLLEVAPEAVHLRCRHRVTGLQRLDDKSAADGLNGRRVVLFAGVGNPGAFATTVAGLGATVVGQRWWPDHHRYAADDVRELAVPGRFPSHDAIVTTEKDAVKVSSLPGIPSDRILVARVDIEFVADDEPRVGELLTRILSLRSAR